MGKLKIFFYLILALSLPFTHGVFAQRSIYTSARVGAIDANTLNLEKIHTQNSEIVKSLAQKLNIEIRRKLSNGKIIELKGVNEIGEPIFTATESNLQAGQTTSTNALYSGGGLDLNIDGSNTILAGRLGIWDGGKVFNTHVEFGNRVGQQDNSTQTADHATHVAGTMIASGVNAMAKGMAFNAQLKAWDYNNDDAEMSAASKDLLVSNHSYGQLAGWVYNDSRSGDQKWEWYGNTQISNYEDYKFGLYDSQSQSWDRIAYNAPYYLIVKSAGNKGDETGPGISKTDTTKTLEKYYLGSTNDTSNVARSKNDTFDNLPTYSVAKNVLTVGAVSIIPNGPSLASDIKISSFSSWGPTDDGRIKPDIVGPGVNLFSTTNVSTKSYAFLSGTSMASPQVAGSIFLLQDLYAQLNNNNLMRSSTLKALVLHTADDAGRPGPDYTYGWGLLNMKKAAKVLINKDKTHSLDELTLNQSGTFTKKIVANGKDPLIATIAWTDPEGTPITPTAANLNSRVPKLINDLDITITDGKNNYQAWVLDPSNPASNASKGDNYRDNVEQVYIPNPIPGKEYTIKISHKNTLSKNLQEYALVISGAGGVAYCSSVPNSPEGTKIEKVIINNLNYTAPTGCTSYTDNTGQKVELTPGQKLTINLGLNTCTVAKDNSYAIFADWNIDGDFDDEGEKLATNATLSSTTQITYTVLVPANISPGSNTRMRIVVSEETNPASCGKYSNGETMDILLSFIHPKVDLAVTSLIYPDENICRGTQIDNLSFLLNNKGTNAVSSGQILVNILENNTEIISQTNPINISIPGLSNAKFNVPISLSIKPDKIYKLQIIAKTSNDESSANDSILVERSIGAEVLSNDAQVVDCNNATVSLISKGAGAAFWYDAPEGGNLLAVGNSVTINKPSLPTVFYASQNDLEGIMGPKTKKEYAGGTYSGNFGPKPLISTKAPIRLESARLYIGHSGKIIFTVERVSDLTPVATVSLDVVATRNENLGNAANGQQLDDTNDPGAIYNLNLDIPEAGDYQIAIDYEDGASIFRSNQGVSGFPFTLQNAVTLSGSSFNGSVLTNAWYYFYNLKVKSLGCASPRRTLATSANATSLSTNIAANSNTNICPNQTVTLSIATIPNGQYQWLKDNVAIGDANKNNLVVSQSGNYTLKVSDGGVCPAISNSISVNVKSPQKPTISASANILTASESEAYQWIYAKVPISGANQRTYSATQAGTYTLLATVDGCSIMSSDIYVTILADEILNSEKDFIVFPNPVFNNLTIENPLNKPYKYQIINSLGQILEENILKPTSNQNQIPFSYFATGLYFLRIESDKKVFLKKVVKR